jgi:DNA-binding response OmpR family regulator
MSKQDRILIVEDDALIAMDLEDELTDRGFDPVSAATIAHAQQVLESEPLMFVVLDMHLRSETTFEFARELQERGVAFLFLSGNDRSSLPEDLQSSKILEKPVHYDTLVEMIG